MDAVEQLVAAIASRATTEGIRVAVAESLTGGQIAVALARAEGAGEWFAGSVVAYMNETKYHVLGVEHGPVVTASCAAQMARGVLAHHIADVAVSITGVGGPGEEEGQPAGTVYIGLATAYAVQTSSHHFAGSPEQVVEASVEAALTRLLSELEVTARSTAPRR